jgi:hypothetical protein
MIGPPRGLSGILWIRVPGVAATELHHLLRAATCFREDVPVPASGDAFLSAPIDENLLDAQSTLAGYFSGIAALPRRYPRLLRDPRVFRLTAIGEPCETQAVVYRHLVGRDPTLPQRKPRVFGSLESFLDTRREPVTTELGGALGRSSATLSIFDAIVVADDMEKSLRFLIGSLRERLRSDGHDPSWRRQAELFRLLDEYDASIAAAFGGGEAQSRRLAEDTRRGYLARNPRDAQFYERARMRLDARAGARRRIFTLRGARSDARPSEPVFVFNHLPKSYGTSVREWLQTAFGVLEDHTRFLGREGVLGDFPACVDRLASDTVLCGHFSHEAFLLPRRYPEIWNDPKRFFVFTFVRDPLDTAVSNYRHVVERYPEVVARQPALYASLSAYLLALKNPIAKRLGVEFAPNALNRYFFIGAAEARESALAALVQRMREVLAGAAESRTVRRACAALAALESQSMPHANPGRNQREHPDVPAEVGDEFRRRNELDFDIHHAAMVDPVNPQFSFQP